MIVTALSLCCLLEAQPIPEGVDRVSFVPPRDLDHDGTVRITDFPIILTNCR